MNERLKNTLEKVLFDKEYNELFSYINQIIKSREIVKSERDRYKNTINQIKQIFDEGDFEKDCDCIKIEELLEKGSEIND